MLLVFEVPLAVSPKFHRYCVTSEDDRLVKSTTSGGQSVAIIEYNGHSGSYTSGQAIGGGYTVNGISGKSVSINGNTVSVGGRR